jgi:PAS domain-containing protein
VFEDPNPVRWTGEHAVVVLPEHIDLSNAGQIREELLSVVNRGATVLIVDMSETVSCDHAAADAGLSPGCHQRHGVAAGGHRPGRPAMLSISGLDRLVSIYPSLEAATTAKAPAVVLPLLTRTGTGGQEASRRAVRTNRPVRAAGRPEMSSAAVTPAVVLALVDALNDGVALADADGTIALANRRMEEIFGYGHGELLGCPVESLIPADLRAAHRRHRVGYAQAPRIRPMRAGARLVGLLRTEPRSRPRSASAR